MDKRGGRYFFADRHRSGVDSLGTAQKRRFDFRPYAGTKRKHVDFNAASFRLGRCRNSEQGSLRHR